MGRHIHRVLIVTSSFHIEVAQRIAVAFGFSPTAIVTAEREGYKTFFIPPLGGKEDWPNTEIHGRKLDEYMDSLDGARGNYEYALVEYGNDTLAKVVRNNQ